MWKPIHKSKVPPKAKVIDSTWAMKKKANGDLRARLNGKGFQQVKGVHYNENDIASPVVHDMTIRVCLTLMIMSSWTAWLLDVSGAFLNGRFGNGEEIYMRVPQGFERFYPTNVLLLLLRTIYGTKQGAIQYWRETQKAFKYLKYQRSGADPCLYFKRISGKLVLWLTWVDDCLILGEREMVLMEKEQFKTLFDLSLIHI